MRFYFYRNWRKYNAVVYAPSAPGGDSGFVSCGEFTDGFIHTWIVPPDVRLIEVFMVGRGGESALSSTSKYVAGGGGYTKTFKANNVTVDPNGWAKDGGPILVVPGETLYFSMRKGRALMGPALSIPLNTCVGRNFTGMVSGGSVSFNVANVEILAAVDRGFGGSIGASYGGDGGSGGAVVAGPGGSNGTDGASYPSSLNANGGVGQHHTTRPFAEDGSWASALNLPLLMNVPYAAGGGTGAANYGGGSQNVPAVEGYGGGEGFYNSSPAYGCIIVRWLI